MPNWTYNTLELRCNDRNTLKEATAFVNNSKDKRQLDFNKVIPVPKELLAQELHSYGGKDKEKQDLARKDALNDFGFSNSLEFCVHHWGTKWNACDVTLSTLDTKNGKSNIYYHFNTAWSPPIALITEWSKKFPSVEFILEAEEEGGMFNPFTMVIKNGDILSEVERD